MSLNDLVAIVPPPKRPKEVGPEKRWQEAVSKLGTELPPDYKRFVDTYGTGLFAGLYWVHTPYAKDPYGNLVQYTEMVSEHLCSRHDVPFAIHPTQPGLLLWGHDENGNHYYWLTKGTPDQWTIVTESVRGTGFAKHKCNMVEYLLRVQQLKIPALASAYPPLAMRCPCEACAGYANGSHDADSQWYCETCGYEWPNRQSFENDVAKVIKKHSHRRACYIKKRGHYLPASKELEPANYKQLVRKEIID